MILQMDQCTTQDIPLQLFDAVQVDYGAAMNLGELLGIEALPEFLERRANQMALRHSNHLRILLARLKV